MTAFAKPTVLVVEDETLIRMLAVDAFLEEGFEVLEAEHAVEALGIHDRATTIEVLFTDVNMPGELNGIDLAERLKAAALALHVIITSALPILRPSSTCQHYLSQSRTILAASQRLRGRFSLRSEPSPT
jgi:CheY-like chemotaxis protein